MLDILQKYGIQYTMQRHVRYLNHSQLYHYVNVYDQNGVLTAISNSCSCPGSIKLDENEAVALMQNIPLPDLVN